MSQPNDSGGVAPLSTAARDHRAIVDRLLVLAFNQGPVRDDETEWARIEVPAYLWRAVHLAADEIAESERSAADWKQKCLKARRLAELYRDDYLRIMAKYRATFPPPAPDGITLPWETVVPASPQNTTQVAERTPKESET